MFVIVVIWNMISPGRPPGEAIIYTSGSIIIACVVGVHSTVWMLIGRIVDLKKLFRDLAARVDNPWMTGRRRNVSLADRRN